jgi:protein required for attachment to host cells
VVNRDTTTKMNETLSGGRSSNNAGEVGRPMKAHVTWIVVADRGRALVFENQGPGKGVKRAAIPQKESPHRAAREIMADKPGRAFDSHGQGRHAMEPQTDPVKVEMRTFLAEVIGDLSRAHRDKKFDRLVLIAPPAALGEMRKLLPQELELLVIGEIDKDLTHANASELTRHLGEVMPV